MSAVKVSSIMTKDVFTVRASASLADAARLMRKEHVSGLPVLDESGRLVGLLSEKDILRSFEDPLTASLPASLIDIVLAGDAKAQASLEKLRRHLETTRVHEWMTPEPFTISAEAPVSHAAEIMRERRINRLPVVDSGALLGIVTRHDVLHAL